MMKKAKQKAAQAAMEHAKGELAGNAGAMSMKEKALAKKAEMEKKKEELKAQAEVKKAELQAQAEAKAAELDKEHNVSGRAADAQAQAEAKKAQVEAQAEAKKAELDAEYGVSDKLAAAEAKADAKSKELEGKLDAKVSEKLGPMAGGAVAGAVVAGGAAAAVAATGDGENEVVMEGSLQKLGGAKKDKWETRDFKLTKTTLSWSDGGKVKGEISTGQIDKLVLYDDDLALKDFAFGIQTSGVKEVPGMGGKSKKMLSKLGGKKVSEDKDYRLAASSNADRAAWEKAIQTVMPEWAEVEEA